MTFRHLEQGYAGKGLESSYDQQILVFSRFET
jgi:hypothetical protein